MMEHLLFPFKENVVSFIKCQILLWSFAHQCAVGLMAAVFFTYVITNYPSSCKVVWWGFCKGTGGTTW